MINEVIGSIFRLYRNIIWDLKNSLYVDMSSEWQAYINFRPSLGPPIYICKYVAKRSQDFQLNYVQLKGRYLEWQCRAALNLLIHLCPRSRGVQKGGASTPTGKIKGVDIQGNFFSFWVSVFTPSGGLGEGFHPPNNKNTTPLVVCTSPPSILV